MHKELKIIKPEITCFLHHTHLLIPIKGHANYYDWFFSNYIQLMLEKEFLYKKVKGEHLLDFLNLDFSYGIVNLCPLIDYQIYDSALVRKHINRLDLFLKDSIDAGYYINIYLDDYYVADRRQFHTEHFIHDHLLFGYTDDSFLSYGYKTNQHLGNTKISIKLIEEMFLYEDHYPINLFREKKAKFSYDNEYVIHSIYDYLESQNTTDGIRNYYLKKSNMVYGIEIYSYLYQYYDYVIKQQKDIDLRIISVLYDHKKCMYLRCIFLRDNMQIRNLPVEEFEDLTKKVEICRNIQIRYNLNKDSAIIDLINKQINYLKNKEIEAMTKLLKILKSLRGCGK